MNHDQLLVTLNKIGQKTIFFGPQGFELFINEQEIGQAQIGYGLDEQGQPLSGENDGDWQYSWLVIARDTELGDAYFIDLNDDNYPVFSAFQGESTWEVEQVSSSLIGFISCLQILFSHGQQQRALFVPEKNTMTDANLLKNLQTELVTVSGSEHFWTLFFSCYSDWLSEDY